METAADVYACELLPLGHGLPLWDPDPVTAGEVHIGDVGHIKRGTFFRLFNTLGGSEDQRNRGRRLPEHFEELSLPDELQFRNPRAIHAGAICSKSIKVRSVATQGNGLYAYIYSNWLIM